MARQRNQSSSNVHPVSNSRGSRNTLTFHPATASRWSDIEELFGDRGACGGCWCMFWRIPRKEYEQNKGQGNKRAFKKIVTNRGEPGILAYHDKEPIGWCAIAPREEYIALERSRILKPVDDKPVWSISCLFIKKPYRRKGVSSLRARQSSLQRSKEQG